MSDDLIARLKAAHEAARTPGDPSYQLYMAEVEDKLFRENATEIIAALEERDRMRAVVRYARHDGTCLFNHPRSWGAFVSREPERDYCTCGYSAALDALEKRE